MHFVDCLILKPKFVNKIVKLAVGKILIIMFQWQKYFFLKKEYP